MLRGCRRPRGPTARSCALNRDRRIDRKPFRGLTCQRQRIAFRLAKRINRHLLAIYGGDHEVKLPRPGLGVSFSIAVLGRLRLSQFAAATREDVMNVVVQRMLKVVLMTVEHRTHPGALE